MRRRARYAAAGRQATDRPRFEPGPRAAAPRAGWPVGAISPWAVVLLVALLQGCGRLDRGAARDPAAIGPQVPPPGETATDSPALATLVGQAAYAASPQRIDVPDGSGHARRSGTLAPGAVARFVFGGPAGAAVDLAVSSGGGAVSPGLAGDDGTQLKYPADGLTSWQGALPTSQDYHLTLLNAGGSTATYDLRLDLAVAAESGSAPRPTTSPTASPHDARAAGTAPDGGAATLFSSGALTRTMDVATRSADGRAFSFEATAGQVLTASARGTDGITVNLQVQDPSGRQVVGPRAGLWRGPLPLDGAYLLRLSGGGNGAVTLAAGLSTPVLSGGGVRAVSGPPPWLLEGEVLLLAGQVGGDSWTVPSTDRDQLEIVLTEAPDEASALVALWSGADRALTLIDPALPGTMHLAPAAGGESVVTFLWSGGARGRNVSYSARIDWR